MDIGLIYSWCLRGICLGVFGYGLLKRNIRVALMGLCGFAGSLTAWGLFEFFVGNRVYGILSLLIGGSIIAFLFIPALAQIYSNRRKRKGYWIQVNDEMFWIPPGTTRVEMEFHIRGAETENPAEKIDRSMLPKKGEKEKDYRDRMR